MFLHNIFLLSIGSFIAAILAFLIVAPLVDHVYYVTRVHMKRKRLGVEPVLTMWGQPLGLKWFVYFYHGLKEENLPQKIALVFNNTIGTGRIQGLSEFGFWTVEPENIKAILATQFNDFSLGKRHSHFFPLLGDGIFTLDGSGWSHSRAMLRPQFSREQISHVHATEKHLQKVIGIFKNAKHEFTDIQKVMFDLTTDTATEFLFGESVALLSGGNPNVRHSREFGEAFNRAQSALAYRVNAQRFDFLINGKEFQEDCALVKRFTESYVQLALARAEKVSENATHSYVFLDELVRETRDPKILRDQALNILLAGRDTTASLLSFLFMELGKNPAIYQRLRSEILAHFGTTADTISFESLKRCEYLRHTINETLRIYPTVPFNFRIATRDTTLPRGGGPDGTARVFVPKGSMVTYSVYCMHRRKTIWGEDAEVFDPDRWSRSTRPNSHPWGYLPFNGGPRICLGQQFALTEASYTVARLMQTFERMELKPGVIKSGQGDQPLNSSLTICVGGGAGVPVRFS